MFVSKARSRGELLKLQGDFHGAIEDFNVALRLEPQNTMALSSRGDCKRMLDDCDGAMADLYLGLIWLILLVGFLKPVEVETQRDGTDDSAGYVFGTQV